MQNFKLYVKIWLLVITLLSGFMFLPSCRFLERQGFFRKSILKEALFWARQDSARVADSLKSADFVRNRGIETLSDSLIQMPNKNLPIEKQHKRYHIIVGSFSNTENATLCLKEFFNKGYKPELIVSIGRAGTKIDLVSVRSFDNSFEAKKYLAKFQIEINSKAWLYQNH